MVSQNRESRIRKLARSCLAIITAPRGTSCPCKIQENMSARRFPHFRADKALPPSPRFRQSQPPPRPPRTPPPYQTKIVGRSADYCTNPNPSPLSSNYTSEPESPSIKEVELLRIENGNLRKRNGELEDQIGAAREQSRRLKKVMDMFQQRLIEVLEGNVTFQKQSRDLEDYETMDIQVYNDIAELNPYSI
jgi:hypothetical protein